MASLGGCEVYANRHTIENAVVKYCTRIVNRILAEYKWLFSLTGGGVWWGGAAPERRPGQANKVNSVEKRTLESWG